MATPTIPAVFYQLLQEHLTWLKVRNFSPSTVRTRGVYVRAFGLWCLERALLRPAQLNKPMIEAFQRHLYRYRKPDGQPLAWSSQHLHLKEFRQFFAWLAKQNVIPFSPPADIDLPKQPKSLPKDILSVEEVERILQQPDTTTPLGMRDRAIFEVLYSTGIRLAEACALNKSRPRSTDRRRPLVLSKAAVRGWVSSACSGSVAAETRRRCEKVGLWVMEQLPTPHNNFFHFALSHLPNARGLIETQLSQAALADLNLESLQLQTGSFVDPDLREKFSDLLFSVELKEALEDGVNGQALVYFLFEHKSQSDPLTVLQLLSYILRIWEKRARDGLPLCPVVPLLVYHGETGWTAAQSMAEMIPATDGLAGYQIQFRPPLLDLSELNDDQIQGEPVLRNTLRLLKYSRSKQLVDKLGEILRLIGNSLPEGQLEDWIQAIGIYVMTVNKNIDQQQYKQTLASILPTQFEPGSLADRLLKQGREEGRGEGKLAGKIQALQEVLGDGVSSDEELLSQNPDELLALLVGLQKRLKSRNA